MNSNVRGKTVETVVIFELLIVCIRVVLMSLFTDSRVYKLCRMSHLLLGKVYYVSLENASKNGKNMCVFQLRTDVHEEIYPLCGPVLT